MLDEAEPDAMDARIEIKLLDKAEFKLGGKVAVVTDASQGLAAGIVREQASQGAKVLLVFALDSFSEEVAKLAREIQLMRQPIYWENRVRSCQTELSLVDGWKNITLMLSHWLGPDGYVNVIFNNAAVEVNLKSLGEITPEEYAKVYDMNVRGPLMLTQALLPRLDPQGSNSIINIGSVGSRKGLAGLGLDCSSKAALEGLTRCWAAELGANGTTVNQINLGPMQSGRLDNVPKEIVDVRKMQTPLQNRLGTVEEIARIGTWLASSENSWITGQIISTSGGLEMY